MASRPQPQAHPAQATQTQTQTQPASQPGPVAPTPILRLRGAHTSRQRVQWTEDVVDNEKLNRKKSKVCCIYHRPKGVDESSDESSSSSDSDYDSDAGKGKGSGDRHGDDCGHHHHGRGRKRKGGGDNKRRPSPNAYERVPKVKGRPTPPGGDETKNKA